MPTIRGFLNALRFDWNNDATEIIYQDVVGNFNSAEVSNIIVTRRLTFDDRILDQDFEMSPGSPPRIPRFVAFDGEWIYFPCHYDGIVWIDRININLGRYLENDLLTPYAGNS